MTDRSVSLKEVYELVDRKMSDVLVEVKDMRAEFSKLEAGRLTKVETTVAELSAIVKVNEANAQSNYRTEENSPLRRLGYEIIKYVLLAVIGAGMILLLK